MNLRIDLQHTCVIDHEGCAILAGRLGDWLPRLCKAQFGLLGDWLTAGTMHCTVHYGCWLLKLSNVQSPLAVAAGSVTALRNFLGQQSLSLRNAQNNLGGRCLGRNVNFWRGRQSLPSQDCVMLSSEAESGPRLAGLADEQLKVNVSVNAWWY